MKSSFLSGAKLVDACSKKRVTVQSSAFSTLMSAGVPLARILKAIKPIDQGF